MTFAKWLMLAFALTIAVWAGSHPEVWWTIVFAGPYVVAYVYFKAYEY